MRIVKRSVMRPGEIMMPLARVGFFDACEPLVVIDSKREIGFWTGVLYTYGDVMPGLFFEVL